MFSKACKYAIRSVLFMATETSGNKKIGVDELAEKLDVPRHFLAKILQQLTKNRLISSSKGRNGGFYLNDKNRKSNLLNVIECIDGPGIFNDCVLGLEECSNTQPCPYHDSIMKYRNEFYEVVKTETIEESAKRIQAHNLRLQNNLL